MQLTPRDKRMLQALGVVAGLAIAYFLFTTVLAGGGGDDFAAPTGPTAPPGTPSVTPSPTPRETLPPVVLAGARDPFSIPPGLDVSPSGSVAPTGTGTTSPPTGTTSPPTSTPPTSPPPTSPPPTSPPPTSPPPPPPPDEPPPGNKITIGGHDVTLLSTNNRRDRLQVEVDGKVYTVEEGALFDENFKLVNLDGRCARFLFGDQSFTLCANPKG